MEAGTKVIGLVRVSTSEQGNSGLGLEAQTETIREECQRRGYLLVDVIVESGVSGRDSDRPGLRRALDRIGSGGANGLIVSKLDRVSRSVVDFGRILEWLKAAGAGLVVIDMDLDTTKSTGKLLANMMMSVAEWEADAISERTTDALAAKKARGEDFGLPKIPNALRERIAAMKADGLSYRAICAALDADGVPTARGGDRWTVGAVQSALGYQRPKRRKAADLPPVPSRRRTPVAA